MKNAQCGSTRVRIFGENMTLPKAKKRIHCRTWKALRMSKEHHFWIWIKYYCQFPVLKPVESLPDLNAPQLWIWLVTTLCTASGEPKQFEESNGNYVRVSEKEAYDSMRKFAFWKRILSNALVTLCSSRDHLEGTKNARLSAYVVIMEIQICSISLYAIHCPYPNSQRDEYCVRSFEEGTGWEYRKDSFMSLLHPWNSFRCHCRIWEGGTQIHTWVNFRPSSGMQHTYRITISRFGCNTIAEFRFLPGTRCWRIQCALFMDIFRNNLLFCERGHHRFRRYDAQVML